MQNKVVSVRGSGVEEYGRKEDVDFLRKRLLQVELGAVIVVGEESHAGILGNYEYSLTGLQDPSWRCYAATG